MPTSRTHYDTLKVSRDAPIEVIQAAYRSLARKYHPDRNGHTPEGEAAMKAINAAYEVLGDPARRADYDRCLAQHPDQPSSTDHGPPSSAHGPPSTADRPRSTDPDLSQTLLTWLLSLCYFSVALWMLRNPGLRFLGILMLLAGLFYFRPRRR